MCKFCEKIETTKNGLRINLDIAKGIYDNHKTCRYCVCKQDGFVIYLAQDIDEAEKVFGTYRNYLDVEIVDLETYTSTTKRRVKRMSEILKDFDKKNEIPKVKIPKFATGGICNDAIFPKLDAFSQIDEIVKDIAKKKDNAIAMEFTKCIGELLRKNGVVPKITEYTRNFETDNTFETRYGVSIDELDFSEHDKVFEDKIAELENIINHKLGDWDKHGITYQEILDMKAENQELKQRIAELESKESVKPMKIEFHADNGAMLTPLEVANSLINQNTFKVDELRELSEFLQVYCNHHENRDIEPNIMLF